MEFAKRVFRNPIDTLRHIERPGIYRQFGGIRRFLGGGNTREIGNFTSPGFLIEPLGIPLFADGQVSRDMNFMEQITGPRTHTVPVGAIRGDEGGQDDEPRVGQNLRKFTDPSDIFLPVFR